MFIFQVLSPSPVIPPQTSPSQPWFPASPLILCDCSSTHSPNLPHSSSIPLCLGIKPPLNQGPPLPLMSNKVISATCVCGAMGPSMYVVVTRSHSVALFGWCSLCSSLVPHSRNSPCLSAQGSGTEGGS